ncbi:MAG: hypothetical protein JRJ50_05980 [Deltaproteobacteria bacterium]|nr:hypothetical protein [Deltaproteobacteria bacterium]
MDAPAQSAEKGDFPSIQVLYPPESLKPKKDFKRLLSEYQLWVKQNQDKGYAASLSFSRETAQSEETPWEIRQMIQRIGKNLSAFKWHLLIHLAREFEESQAEADELLYRVKHQKPPLEEALEERPVLKNLFEDLRNISPRTNITWLWYLRHGLAFLGNIFQITDCWLLLIVT